MRTRTAPWDYERRIDIIQPALVRLCPECGGFVFPRSPDNHLACACGCLEWVMILETHIDEVRELIAGATLAAETQLRMEAARACLLREWSQEDLGRHTIISGGEVMEV